MAMLAALVMVTFGVGPAGAQTTVAAAPVAAERGPRWQTLTAAQRSALAPLQRDWSSIDPARKQKWIEVASVYQTMSAQERERVQQRMNDWAQMTPAERGRARLQFQETRQLPAQDRQARWDAYQALGDDERKRLAAKASPAALTPRAAASAAAAAAVSAGVRAPETSAKRNLVANVPPPASVNRPVAPTVVQARPGATTTLVSKAAQPPAHHQPGLPKIAATRGFVDPTTLLPKRGPQGAAIAAAPAASGSTTGRP